MRDYLQGNRPSYKDGSKKTWTVKEAKARMVTKQRGGHVLQQGEGNSWDEADLEGKARKQPSNINCRKPRAIKRVTGQTQIYRRQERGERNGRGMTGAIISNLYDEEAEA